MDQSPARPVNGYHAESPDQEGFAMSEISRRGFLAGATAALGGVAVAARPLFGAETEAEAKIQTGSDVVALGKSGIKTSRLGVGTGTRSGREQASLGQEGFTKFLREAYDRGIRYVDTAQSYQTHQMVGVALKELPRDEIFVQTKISMRGAVTADSAQQALDRVQKDLGVEKLDTVLMHLMSSGRWPTTLRPLMDVLNAAKEKGRVRAVGISMHSMDALAAVADSDFVDVCLVRINPFAINTDGKPETTAEHLKKIHEKGKGVIGMKIYGETGLKSREQRLESLKYVLGLGTVDCFTIGMRDIKQLDETLELIKEAKIPVTG